MPCFLNFWMDLMSINNLWINIDPYSVDVLLYKQHFALGNIDWMANMVECFFFHVFWGDIIILQFYELIVTMSSFKSWSIKELMLFDKFRKIGGYENMSRKLLESSLSISHSPNHLQNLLNLHIENPFLLQELKNPHQNYLHQL